MKKIGVHRKWTTVVMGLVLACQLLTGTGFFCAGLASHVSRPWVSDRTASVDSNAYVEDLSEDTWNGAVSERESVPCSCKKHKKCPTIPRSALTSYPVHRFTGIECRLKANCWDHVAPTTKDYRFAMRGGPPTVEWEVGKPFPSSTPLAITCVLLI